jgi:transketolase
MDQHNGSRGSGQAPAKDFLALTHGQEWVNFYESFDKLVQDHLSRSSELLRRAMSLPEVADREVAQVRAEWEGKLAAERERSHDLLSKLRDEISASHGQVATLAESVQSVASDLSSLSARVSEAIAAIDLPLSAPAAEPVPPPSTQRSNPLPS